MISDSEQNNFEILRECLANPILLAFNSKPPRKARKPKDTTRKRSLSSKNGSVLGEEAALGMVDEGEISTTKSQSTAEELSEFIDYLAMEIFTALPNDIRSLTFVSEKSLPDAIISLITLPLSSSALSTLTNPLPPSVNDSLTTYGLLDLDTKSLAQFLASPLSTYISVATSAPVEYLGKKAGTGLRDACEICSRDWIRLTFHHLVPRSVAAKAVKRGWCAEWEVEKGAWLCRACHSYVHKIEGNEELAKKWKSVESLLGREDVQSWAAWVGTVRWKRS